MKRIVPTGCLASDDNSNPSQRANRIGADATVRWIRASAQRSRLVEAAGATSLEKVGIENVPSCSGFMTDSASLPGTV